MHKRLAFRMILLLAAALLEGFMFVFHVRDMESERLRRELKALSESLALMVGPEEIGLLRDLSASEQKGAKGSRADEKIERLREQFHAIKSRYREFCRVDVVERHDKRLHSLLSSEDDVRERGRSNELAGAKFHNPFSSPETSTSESRIQLPVQGHGRTQVAYAAVRGGDPTIMVRVETDGLERTESSFGWELLTISVVAIGLLCIVLLWWQLHREARIADRVLASEEKFRGITQAALHPIVVTDDQGKITYWNNAAETTFGYRRQDALDQDLIELLIPQRFRNNTRQAFPFGAGPPKTPGPGTRVETMAVRQSGDELPIELNVSTFRLKDRWHTVGVMIDLSSRKWYEAQLEERARAAESANRAKSEFLANMSHEIRTPMNGVIGMTELVLDTDLDPGQREYLEIVQHSAESLLTVINDILDFSKVEARKLVLDPVSFSLRETVEGTIRTLAERAHTKGLELACRIQPETPEFVIGDANRLRQVLINLVGNAIKFTECGEVLVTVERASGEESESEVILEFTVSDTGVGIPEEKLGLIFEPFEQVDGSTTRRHGGTGLGLAIASHLIELMGGRIVVQSQLGQGSTFRFSIRLGRAPAVQEPPAGRRRNELAGMPVLVVDDNATNRRILEEILKSWSMVPTAVATGLEALSLLKNTAASGKSFAVLLFDLMMPEMDGMELARRVRELPEFGKTPLIVLTSGGDLRSDLPREVLKIAAILSKPIRQSDLWRTLKSVIEPTVPIEERGSTLSSRKHPPAASMTRLSDASLKILLAEDNPVNQRVVTIMLQQRKHEVTVVDDGRKAVEACRNHRFDLVLMDIQMPEMDGFEALASIRNLDEETAADTRIVALTAHAMQGDREKCLKAGFDGYLAKPIRSDELDAMISAIDMQAARPQDGSAGHGFDHAFALEQVGGNTAFLRELAQLFLDHAPAQLQGVRDPLDCGKAQVAAGAAHALKGSVSHFLGPEALAPFRELERLCKDGQLDKAREQVVTVESLVEGLCGALTTSIADSIEAPLVDSMRTSLFTT